MKRIPLNRGLFALVDDDDFEWLNRFKWTLHNGRNGRNDVCRTFRVQTKGGETQYFISMAAFIMGQRERKFIDHRDRDPLNNQKSNLRFASISENARNWWRYRSQFGRGVFKNGNKFGARIHDGNRRIMLGSFPTAQQARDAYDEAALNLHGDFAMLNKEHFKKGGKCAV